MCLILTNASFLFGIQVSRVADVNRSIQKLLNKMIVDSFFDRNSGENTPATPDTKLQVIFPVLSCRNVFYKKSTPWIPENVFNTKKCLFS
jgi:hypothetical protein